jgi:serine/threonine-protein kinase RsbW
MLADMDCLPEQTEKVCRITIENGALGVREGLKNLLGDPIFQGLSADEKGRIEIVLAEVLNNVFEHAYAKHPGTTAVMMQRKHAGLHVRITDTGLPFPGAALPKGDFPQLGPCPDLPEGGFGWALIRSLTTNLTYCRAGAENRLCFQISLSDRDN